MIACRSLYSGRVDRILKLTNSYFALKPVTNFQGYQTSHGLSYKVIMGGRKDKQKVGEGNKKLKTTIPVWRPVVTQASSFEESVKDVKIASEEESQEQEMQDSTSTCVSIQQNLTEIAKPMVEVADSSTSSGALQGNVEDRVLGEESEVSTAKHSISVEVGASLLRFIKGKGGSTQKNIEDEMGVRIIFPSSKMEDSIVIEGISIDSVTKASAKIQTVIDEAVKSPNLDYSHFISLPLAIHPELVDKLNAFQNSILGLSDPCLDEDVDSDTNEACGENENEDKPNKGPDVVFDLKADNDNEHVKVTLTSIPLVSYAPKESNSSTLSDLGIDKSIFIKPKTFHLTVLMLKLWNKDRVRAAAEVLQSISTKVMDALDNRPVSIRLKGLDTMRGSLAKALVVYAPVEEIGSEGRLLRACQIIIDAYVEAGLVLEKDANQKLKLHATVINARHRKRKIWKRKVDSFDARSIFKQYGSEEWGDYVIREAHLSQRFVFDENGYYHCCASIPFPENVQED
ncbi:uncharacterized protein LOC107404348 isoform X1 [Ziziphus jujuba]|uniref:Uncharacterized protein LOC107404348 isoform X1 n=2 Tax=Ziziphus jujuba TaxID=326968 RepID=A0A6P3YWT1_ZIZJJ|nr:uncharacterized protein LOC107404348 isoform X1 [Ziziphus jujuba]